MNESAKVVGVKVGMKASDAAQLMLNAERLEA
jgi:hypothetical protein